MRKMTSPAISVVICTHEPSETFARTMRSIDMLHDRDSIEILVVENGSGPAGRALTERETSARPWVRLVSEPRVGLSYARNRGIRETTAPFVAFLDDDAEMSPDWPAMMLRAFAMHPRAGAAGGRVTLEYLEPPPGWLEHLHRLYLGEFEMGERLEELRYPHYPRGSNIALRREALGDDAPFSPRFGKIGSSLMCFEEIDLCYGLEQAGWYSLFVPEAWVIHLIEPFRYDPRWYERRAFQQGKAVRLFERSRKIPRSMTPTQTYRMLRSDDLLSRRYAAGYLAGSLLPAVF